MSARFTRPLWVHAFSLSALARAMKTTTNFSSKLIDWWCSFYRRSCFPPSPHKKKLNVNRKKCVQLYFGHYLIIVWMNNNNIKIISIYPDISEYIRIFVQCFRLPKTRQQYWHYTILHYIYLLVFCTYTLDSYIHQMLPRDL